MAFSAPLFYDDVVSWTEVVLMVSAVIIEVVAFGHCLVQRPDAFPAVSTLSKGGWLALTAGAVLITLLLGPIGVFFTAIGIAIAAVYLLDLRPALRDATEGHGPW